MVISSDAVSGKEKAANSVPLSAGGHMSPHVITSAGSDPNAAYGTYTPSVEVGQVIVMTSQSHPYHFTKS